MKKLFAILAVISIVLVTIGCKGSTGGGTPTSRPFEDIINTGVGTMKAISGGTFLMGSQNGVGKDNERPQRQVTVSDFYMGETEVKQGQWKAVMGNNPSYFDGVNLPVESISWYDAVEFCNALSVMENLTPVYYEDTNDNGIYDVETDTTKVTNLNNTGDVVANWDANGYRLPTEAEWEYAAGGGSSGRTMYAGTSEVDDLVDYAWYYDNTRNTTKPVKETIENFLGLYDMSGNVWEWCWDWYVNPYCTDTNNPKGPNTGSHRVRRGGRWGVHDFYCRVAVRIDTEADYRGYVVGFRVARSL